jgi:hypothetical protein
MKSVSSQRGREENVAQEHCYSHAYRAPVVEMVCAETVEEVHPHHGYTGDVKEVKDELFSSLV